MFHVDKLEDLKVVDCREMVKNLLINIVGHI